MISIINELSRVPYFSFTFFLSVLSPLLCVQAARVYPEPSARFRACNTLSLPSEILHFMRALRWRSHFDGQNLRICGVRMHCENVSDTIWALDSQHFEFMHMFPFSLSLSLSMCSSNASEINAFSEEEESEREAVGRSEREKWRQQYER